ncbi:MAG: T9SS type A sorting domain-containing protein [Bacteroidetes bacterium]|nr:T9SS type A sorting domain-containing protein [Bacteroidota bacterium]
MRKSIILILSILYAVSIFSQEYATDFTVDDCDGISHNLFSELDEGKVIVITWVMPCFSCIGPAMGAYTGAMSFENSHPGQVLYYMCDDYANNSCSSISSWAGSNNMGEADAYFSHSDINMSDYGSAGMPKTIVVGCIEHKVYYNMNYSANGIEDAINEALLDCNIDTSTIDTSNTNLVNEIGKSSFGLNMFPNPVQNTVTVSFEMIESSMVTIDVLNLTGETVLNMSNSFQTVGSIDIQFNTDILSNGCYFLRIQSETGFEIAKFSVAH